MIGKDKKSPLPPNGTSDKGLASNTDKLTITAQSKKSNPLSGYFTPDELDHFTELASKLEHDGGYSRNAAEVEALKAVKPGEYQQCYEIALENAQKNGLSGEAADKYARHEIAALLTRLQGRELQPEPLPVTELQRFEGIAALTEYARRGIKLMPCVPVEDDRKRYRPIVPKDKWGGTATADIERIKKYMSGALWPNVPISLFRSIPAEANLLCVDIDKNHSDGADGESNFYRLLRTKGYDPLPLLLRNLRAFPVRVETPSGGLHLYFSYNGPSIKKAKLTEGVEVFHTDPLTVAGSRKENGEYVLRGNITTVPPFPAELLEIITGNNRPYQAPKNTTYRKENNHRGDIDKELLKLRLREYIAARQIHITKKGSTEWIKCPLHNDDSPSMQINVSGKFAGILKCHACGASLDVFGLARIMAGLPEGRKYFPQAIREVKNALNIG